MNHDLALVLIAYAPIIGTALTALIKFLHKPKSRRPRKLV
jgi:hypothetical protein